jgi:hypothetical protein
MTHVHGRDRSGAHPGRAAGGRGDGHAPGAGRQRGFALATVVFLLVILASIVAATGAMRERGAHANVLEVRQARAVQAARAALEWAAWKVRDPAGASGGVDQLPGCFASPAPLALPGGLAEFDVRVSCVRTPASTDSPPYYLEDVRRVVVYTLTAVAAVGAVDTPERVERRMQMRIEHCKDPASTAANLAC